MLFIKLTSIPISIYIYVIKKGPYLDVFDILFIITYRLLKNILYARQLQLQFGVSYSCKLNKLWYCGSTMFYLLSENETDNYVISIAKGVIYCFLKKKRKKKESFIGLYGPWWWKHLVYINTQSEPQITTQPVQAHGHLNFSPKTTPQIWSKNPLWS